MPDQDDSTTATLPPPQRAPSPPRPKRQPRYNVVLIDDDDHTYEYVIGMLQRLFGYPPERGYQLAREVDATGRVILLTTTFEHAELKRDQIHAFGADRLLARSNGSMTAVLEPVEG
ncbi:MAG: ATP-dependent Clp protease adaptor ClpS [Planctomycetota bacterium]